MSDAAVKDRLYVIGYGPGNDAYLTTRAQEIIEQAEMVINASFSGDGKSRTQDASLHAVNEQIVGFSDRNRTRDRKSGSLAVLLSGDTGFYSLASLYIDAYSERFEVELIPGISDIQYLSSRIKVAYDDALLVTQLHRNEAIVPKVLYNQRIFLLVDAEGSAGYVCEHLERFGLGDVQVTIAERLSTEGEQITRGTAAGLAHGDYDDRAVIYIENPDFANRYQSIGDRDLIHSEKYSSSEEVRWISIHKLNVQPGDVVYDIGAGSGAASVELARKAADSFVYAIESSSEAIALIEQNRLKHKAFNIDVVHGEPAEMMSWLNSPDKAFIRDAGHKLDEIMRWLVAENHQIRIVANVTSLSNLSQVQRIFKKYGLYDVEVVYMNVTRAENTDGVESLLTGSPIFIISGTADTPPPEVKRTTPTMRQRRAERVKARKATREALKARSGVKQPSRGRVLLQRLRRRRRRDDMLNDDPHRLHPPGGEVF
ncbi:MAG: SAM-dependent methyltransferase [Coriobacteriia bacterium]|nr:SAM-dependent methyltransferase [Coriobacteriia bacterium]